MAKIKLPKQRRQYHSVYGLDGGLHTNMGSTMIGEKETPNCADVVFDESMVSKASGTEYFASTDTTPLNGSVIHMEHFFQADGSEKLVAHTISNTYAYNSTSELFECITLGVVVENCEDVWSVDTNVTCAVDTDKRKGTNSVKITLAVGYTTGPCAWENFAGKDLSSYTHLRLFIKSDSATNAADLRIRLSEQNSGGTGATYADYNIPALTAATWTDVSVALDSPAASNGGTYPDDLDAVLSVTLMVVVDNGAQVVHIDDVMATTEMTGNEDDDIASEMMNDLYIYSSVVQTVRYWDMATATTTALPGCSTYKAKGIVKFGERLCLYHTIEGGTDLPQRVRWTAAGTPSSTPDVADWTATGSGYNDLYSVLGSDIIQRAEKIGNYVAIYAESTIVLQEYQNKVDAPFAFYTRVTGVGLVAPRALVNLGNEHIFLGWDNIHIYKGGREVEDIGDWVVDELFDLMSPEYVHRSFMVKVDNEVRLYFPKAGSTTPNEYYAYNLINRSWSRGVRSHTAFGYYETKTTVTWNTATGTYDAQTARWNDSSLLSLAPLNLYGDGSGYVYKGSNVKNLAGSLIDAYWDTKDFVTGDGYRRTMTNWMELHFEAKGDKVDVCYSTDLGATWSEAKEFTLTDVWVKYNYDFEINSPQIRFRFRNNTISSTFSVRWIEHGFMPASDRGVA